MTTSATTIGIERRIAAFSASAALGLTGDSLRLVLNRFGGSPRPFVDLPSLLVPNLSVPSFRGPSSSLERGLTAARRAAIRLVPPAPAPEEPYPLAATSFRLNSSAGLRSAPQCSRSPSPAPSSRALRLAGAAARGRRSSASL